MSINISATLEDQSVMAHWNYETNTFDIHIFNSKSDKSIYLKGVESRAFAASLALALDSNAFEDKDMLCTCLRFEAMGLTGRIEDKDLSLIP